MFTFEHKQALSDTIFLVEKPIQLIIHKGPNGLSTFEMVARDMAKELEAESRLFEVCEAPERARRAALELACEDRGGIFYSAFPEGKQWDVFLQTIRALDSSDADLAPESRAILNQLTQPTILDVWIGPGCPFCPGVVSAANRLAVANPLVESWIIDASVRMDEAAAQGIRSTPTVFANGRMRWVGEGSQNHIAGLLADAEEESWAANLETQVRAGAIEDAVDTLLAHPSAGAALATILALPDLPLRLAALRAIEEAVEQSPGACSEVVIPLCDMLQHENAQTRGDVAYALGLIRDSRAAHALSACLDDDDPDVCEAIKEALENMA